jgi:hypothetical protein
MVSNNTPLVGLVGIILVVAIIAILGTLGFSSNDILNPNTSAAAAHAKEQEIQTQSQKDIIDLEAYRAAKKTQTEKEAFDLANYKAIQSARTQAEQDKTRLEVQARERELEQDIELARLTRYTLLGGSVLALLVLSAGATMYLNQIGRSRLVLAQARSLQMEQIGQARAREVVDRKAGLAHVTPQPFISGNGNDPSKAQPVKAAG